MSVIFQATPLPQIAYAAASITNSYTLAGAFTKAVIQMIIISTLDQPVQISFDGTNDNIAIPAGSTVPVYMPIEFVANNAIFNAKTVYVKEIGNPTVGSLYISGFTISQ